MNTAHNSKRILSLSAGFTEGTFTVHKDTFCVTIDDPRGWIYEPDCVKRFYKAGDGSRGVVVSSVEAIARSLIGHDHINHQHDPLVGAMVAQYCTLYATEDQNQTLHLMDKMFVDRHLHVRAARGGCPSRGKECHNPLHRRLQAKRVKIQHQYGRFLRAYEQNQRVLSDPMAHVSLRMSHDVLEKCRTMFGEEICNRVGL